MKRASHISNHFLTLKSQSDYTDRIDAITKNEINVYTL